MMSKATRQYRHGTTTLRIKVDFKDVIRCTILTGLRISEPIAAKAKNIQRDILAGLRIGTKLECTPFVHKPRELLEKHGHFDKSGRCGPNNMRHKLQTRLKKTGLKSMSYHVLQHTFAFRLEQKGALFMQIPRP